MNPCTCGRVHENQGMVHGLMVVRRSLTPSNRAHAEGGQVQFASYARHIGMFCNLRKLNAEVSPEFTDS